MAQWTGRVEREGRKTFQKLLKVTETGRRIPQKKKGEEREEPATERHAEKRGSGQEGLASGRRKQFEAVGQTMTKVSSYCSMEKGSMGQTKSVDDKAGGDTWAKMRTLRELRKAWRHGVGREKFVAQDQEIGRLVRRTSASVRGTSSGTCRTIPITRPNRMGDGQLRDPTVENDREEVAAI